MEAWDFDAARHRTLDNDYGDSNGDRGDGWGHGSNHHWENDYFGDGFGDGTGGGGGLRSLYWDHNHADFGEELASSPPVCVRRS